MDIGGRLDCPCRALSRKRCLRLALLSHLIEGNNQIKNRWHFAHLIGGNQTGLTLVGSSDTALRLLRSNRGADNLVIGYLTFRIYREVYYHCLLSIYLFAPADRAFDAKRLSVRSRTKSVSAIFRHLNHPLATESTERMSVSAALIALTRTWLVIGSSRFLNRYHHDSSRPGSSVPLDHRDPKTCLRPRLTVVASRHCPGRWCFQRPIARSRRIFSADQIGCRPKKSSLAHRRI
jgi:hypothetical protein